ncbi:hypothetical protein Tco_0633364 [Tanacetum coccineum]
MPNCPICKASRWKDPKKTKGKKVEKKVVRTTTSPTKDVDVYLQPLIKKLQELWKRVWMKDAATGTHFQMKAAVLWTINDFLARSSLSGWSGQGYYACPTCNEDTPSMAVKIKIVYVGHRRFLRTKHPLRSKFKEFYGFPEPKPKPRKFTKMDIQLQISKVFKRFPGKHPDIAKKNPKPNRKIELNWSKRSIFWDLEYWPFLLLKNNLDVMHIEKNALEALLNTLLQNDKSKDTLKARQDLETLIVRKELWLVKKPNGKFEKPHPKYSFTLENRKRFCKFIKGVRLPDGFGSNFKQKVTADDNNITGMKSHDCHIMMHRWMFPFERYMKKLKNYVRNKAKPEGSIAEGYVAEEALTFCSRYLKDDVETRFNRLGRNDDGLPEEEPDKFQVFRSVCKPTGRMKETRLTTDVMQAVVWFVLNNSPEVDADILAYRDACTYLACIVNGVKFVVHERDILHTTQCSGVSTPGLDGDISATARSVEQFIIDMGRADQDVIHGSSSSHVTLSVGLTCLEHTDLSINAQSTEGMPHPDSHDGEQWKSTQTARTGPVPKYAQLGKELPGWCSNFSPGAQSSADEDVMTRDQMTQILRQQEQEKELYRKQAEKAQAWAYLASLKADAADQRANVAYQIEP